MTREADVVRRASGSGRAPNAVVRVVRAWAALEREQRRAALAAIALWITLLLPWYHESAAEFSKARAVGYNVSGFGAFSFVEASLLVVSIAVLAMLFARAERRAFHLPGGDGFVITLAGGWQAVLIFYRMLDTPNLSFHGSRIVTDVGVQWGIFFALLAAIWLAYAGTRVRAAHRPEPAFAEDPTIAHRRVATAGAAVGGGASAATQELTAPAEPAAPAPTRRLPPAPGEPATPAGRRPAPRRPVTRDDAEQLSFDVSPQVERDPFGERESTSDPFGRER